MSDEQNGFNPAFSKYDGMKPEELIRAMAQLKAEKEDLEEAGKLINAEFDFLRLIKIPAVFDDAGISIMKVDGVGRCNLTADIYAGIVADKKEDAFIWLSDSGRGDLIVPTVNASTLKAAIKASLKKGENWPEEFFRVQPFSRASITKA